MSRDVTKSSPPIDHEANADVAIDLSRNQDETGLSEMWLQLFAVDRKAAEAIAVLLRSITARIISNV